MSQLKDLAFWNEQYLQELPTGEFEWLELKDSHFFGTDAAFLDRMSSYLSAFANYEGGYLVIGIQNPHGGQPLHIDGGVKLNLKANLSEWFEDKLPNLVDPPLTRIHATAVTGGRESSKISVGNAVMVIHVPASEQAPHQARDKKYWGRMGNKLHPLSHRAILDILSRRKHPKVETTLHIGMGLHLERNELVCRMVNTGTILARYIYCVIHVPFKLDGKHIAFEDANFINDDDGSTYWRVKTSNHLNRPLFPGSDFVTRFPFKVVGGPFRSGPEADAPVLAKTIPSIQVRTYADEMPFVEQEVDHHKIIIRTGLW